MAFGAWPSAPLTFSTVKGLHEAGCRQCVPPFDGRISAHGKQYRDFLTRTRAR